MYNIELICENKYDARDFSIIGTFIPRVGDYIQVSDYYKQKYIDEKLPTELIVKKVIHCFDKTKIILSWDDADTERMLYRDLSEIRMKLVNEGIISDYYKLK